MMTAQKETPHHKGQGAKIKHFGLHFTRLALLMLAAALVVLTVMLFRWLGDAL